MDSARLHQIFLNVQSFDKASPYNVVVQSDLETMII